MSNSDHARTHSRRQPLGDATRRVNNSHHHSPSPQNKQLIPVYDSESLRPESNIGKQNFSTVTKETVVTNSNRNSQISTTSTTASDGRRRKTHIGPWHLGKTLGKGATARVRMARHAVTGQLAAIKIVQKKNAQLSQAGSLASLDQKDGATGDSADGVRKMPYGIEREVAIMKLIEHPHIMKLYDIWENRTEIYLVLEYIDNGELFDHISRSGRLHEEEAVKYFRQLISAVGYCHSFNICHRDLKPENILLTKDGDVKIADFGMAALQQTPEHRLKTSCGSPHYAAPEVIKGASYRGDKVDIWSMGVILYAALSGRLPFDSTCLPDLLALIQRGQYRMSSAIGPEAADLIHRLLQVDARDRLSIKQIWRHPLLKKYSSLDSLGSRQNLKSPTAQDCGRPVLRRGDVDKELLRHLRSMWHRFDENQIIKLLLNDQPNDQKLFYTLLLKHRENQLENYVPDLGYSNSDYHHVRNLDQVKKLSTCQFVQPASKGHGRQISRFTVLSNVSKSRHARNQSLSAGTEAAETVLSYDPFKASRIHKIEHVAATGSNVVVYHDRGSLGEICDRLVSDQTSLQGSKKTPRTSHESTAAKVTQVRTRPHNLSAPPRTFVSRSSLASSTRSRSSNPVIRAATGYKRGVSFTHMRKPAIPAQRNASAPVQPRPVDNRPSKCSDAVDGGAEATYLAVECPPSSTANIRSWNISNSTSQAPHPLRNPNRISRLWHEDVRQLSSSLAKDCDVAFNRTSATSMTPSYEAGGRDSRYSSYNTPQSSILHESIIMDSSPVVSQQRVDPTNHSQKNWSSWDTRPLPPPPSRSESIIIELAEALRQAQLRKLSGDVEDSPGHIDRMVSHIDRLMQPTTSPIRHKNGRRVLSAPTNPRTSEVSEPLPSIYESTVEDGFFAQINDFTDFFRRERVRDVSSNRVTSAPEPRDSRRNVRADASNSLNRGDAPQRLSIRVVEPSSPSPAKPPAPLNIRKQRSQGPPPQPNLLSRSGGDQRLSGPTLGHCPPEFDLRQQYAKPPDNDIRGSVGYSDKDGHHDDPFKYDISDGVLKPRKLNWFKRHPGASENGKRRFYGDGIESPSRQSSNHNASTYPINEDLPANPVKKKPFGLGRLFKRRNVNRETSLAVAGLEDHEDDSTVSVSIAEDNDSSHNGQITSFENPKTRQIYPHQNWLARLFHVKPATELMCFAASKRRIRQEIVTLLKEWRKYGMREIAVDNERSIIFGRVCSKNYLNMKEVSFACEIMTVIEHGKRSALSIVRFTQEKGAASSFHKVVETLAVVLKSRGMSIPDERRRIMMIKTLNAA